MYKAGITFLFSSLFLVANAQSNELSQARADAARLSQLLQANGANLSASSLSQIRGHLAVALSEAGGASSDPLIRQKCADEAYRGPFSRDQATRLCQQANTNTSKCALEAYRGPFDTEQAVALCTLRATSETITCALEAYRGPFDQAQSVALCKNGGTRANVSCAINAYRGPYNQEQAVTLCKNP